MLKTQLGGAPSTLFDAASALLVHETQANSRGAKTNASLPTSMLLRVVVETAALGDAAARHLSTIPRSTLRKQPQRVRTGWRSAEPATRSPSISPAVPGGREEFWSRRFARRVLRHLPTTTLRQNAVSQAEGAALLAIGHARLNRGPDAFTQLAGSGTVSPETVAGA